jgi:hypothetical protein
MTSHLNKMEAVRGVNAYLGANYGITWANEKVASEVCEYVAGQLQGPDKLPESGLHPQSALKIAQELFKAHEALKAKGLAGDPDSLRKTAANMTVSDLASATVRFDMELLSKRADALIMSGGQHTNRPGESPDSIAKLDQHNRPQGEYLVGMGNTDVKPAGAAVVGKEQPHPKAPENTSPTPNSVTEHSKAANAIPVGSGSGTLAGLGTPSQSVMNQVQGVGGRALHSLKQAPGSIMDALKSAPGKAMDAIRGMDPQTQLMAAGALGGGAAGAIGGGLASDDHPGLGALGGGLAGAGLGAGLGYGASQMSLDPKGAIGSKLLNMPEGAEAALLGLGGAAAGAGAGAMAGKAMDKESQDQLAYLLKSAQELGMSNDQALAFLNKIATGGSLTNSKPNTPEDAAKHDSIAKLDQQNRSTDKYLKGVGNTEMPNVGRVEHAAKRPDQPGTSEKSPSTVPSKETKSAADEAFMTVFKKTAEEVGPYLPTHMDQETKIAHVRMMMGMSVNERADYLRKLGG